MSKETKLLTMLSDYHWLNCCIANEMCNAMWHQDNLTASLQHLMLWQMYKDERANLWARFHKDYAKAVALSEGIDELL